jgi:hypothetical protein
MPCSRNVNDVPDVVYVIDDVEECRYDPLVMWMSRACVAFAPFLALSACAYDVEQDAPEAVGMAQGEIVQGTVVEGCGWPVTVGVGNGCSGSLVHPRVITTAVHCGPGPGTQVRFGPTLQSAARTVTIAGCVSVGTDAAICELGEAVSEIPYAPIAYGCELAQYVTVGQPVVFSGFGVTQFGGGIDGSKRWAAQTITAVNNDHIVVGQPGMLPSPCSGDSGGPVHVSVADGSWRTVGSLLGGTTGIPCNSAANYQRSDLVVQQFEQDRGIDITPCFDAVTGTWDPSAECTGFYAGSEMGTDTWANLCADEPKSGFSDTCGAPFDAGGGQGGSGGGQGGAAGEGGNVGQGGTLSGGEDQGGNDDDGSMEASDCGCTVPGAPAPSLPLPVIIGFALAGWFARRP